MIKTFKKGIIPEIYLVILFTIIFFLFSCKLFSEKQKKERQNTEEIIVSAKAPKNKGLSSVSQINDSQIKTALPKTLADILNYSSGVYISTGGKGESSVKIRGLSSKRTLLLFDGIPLYEPYFNSYGIDLIPADEIKEIKIIKGASSVLYGPNTLGGVINIITKRLESNYLSLNFQYAPNETYYMAVNGGVVFDRFSFIGNLIYDASDGFFFNEKGEKKLRENSDYRREHFIGKLFYYPDEDSEILGEFFLTKSIYGIPLATEIYNKRYWRFSDWQRIQFNIGGSFKIFNKGLLKIRNYYIRHYNILDAFKSEDYKEKKWSSTFNNYSLGSFLLSSFDVNAQNKIEISLNFRKDNVRTKSNIGQPYNQTEQQLFSVGMEDYFSLSSKIKLISGISIDYLNKRSGKDKTVFNPILGIKYNPKTYLSFSVNYSNKTRFPSMKSLYSLKGGNPELHAEIGKNIEFNFSYNRYFKLNCAIFYNRIEDMITSIRLPSGYHQYQNIGKAEIKGVEFEFAKKLSYLETVLNFTYLKTINTDTGRQLDLIPERQFNFMINTKKIKGFILSIWGVLSSKSQTSFREKILNIPSYYILNFSIKKEINRIILYVKGENILNKEYYTEPGYPMKGRTVSIGLKFKIGG